MANIGPHSFIMSVRVSEGAAAELCCSEFCFLFSLAVYGFLLVSTTYKTCASLHKQLVISVNNANSKLSFFVQLF